MSSFHLVMYEPGQIKFSFDILSTGLAPYLLPINRLIFFLIRICMFNEKSRLTLAKKWRHRYLIWLEGFADLPSRIAVLVQKDFVLFWQRRQLHKMFEHLTFDHFIMFTEKQLWSSLFVQVIINYCQSGLIDSIMGKIG